MKSLRTPVILMGAAALLAIGVYFVEFGRRSEPKPTLANAPISSLFGFREQAVQGMTIKTLATTVVLEKSTGWLVRSPQPVGPANEAIVAFLLNLFNSPRERELKIPANRRGEFGLEQPMATIEVKLDDQKMHTLILGKLNFDRTGLYAIVDPSIDPQAELTVVILPTSFESAVNRPVDEWRSKPATPKPPTPKPSDKPR